MKRIVLGLVLLGACGGDDEEETPAQKCNAYITAYCERFVTCEVVDEVSKCREAVEDFVDCSKVVAVSKRLPMCFEEFKTWTCSMAKAAELPDACKEVLLLKQ